MDGTPDTFKLEKLTERERHVLTFLAEGRTNHEIAKTWGISTKTIDTHRLNLLRKLALRNNADLTRFAIRVGLVMP
jgi:two-component system invasion response regulator UvrY